MTILLVFMIQSFRPGAPRSCSRKSCRSPSPLEGRSGRALSIVISSSEVVLEGKRVLSLRNGKVDRA